MSVFYATLLSSIPSFINFQSPALSKNPSFFLTSLTTPHQNTSPDPRILQSSTCSIPNCSKCEIGQETCIECFQGFQISKNFCISSAPTSAESLSLFGLVFLIVGSVVFITIFCVMYCLLSCIYYAKKHKPRYSGNRNLNNDITMSKSSIDEEVSVFVQTLSNSQTPMNRDLADGGLTVRNSAVFQIYKKLKTLKKNPLLLEDCAICFRCLNTSSTKVLVCRHVYHRKCLKEWMFSGNLGCPTCSLDI